MLASGVLFAWAHVPRIARAEGRDPRLLVIVLRGALDGLAAVAPVGDPDYAALRGDKVLRLDGPSPALPLDRFFALNPAMPNLHRLYAPARRASSMRSRRPIASAPISTARTCSKAVSPRPGATDIGWLNRALSALEPGGRVDPGNRRRLRSAR